MGLTLITAPTADVITLAEARAFCGVEDTSFDTLLTSMIATAVVQVEGLLGRAIAPQTWRLTLDEFADAILLPKGPVTAVSHVKYDDAAGAEQTLPADTYTLDLVSDPQWLVLNTGESWPALVAGVNAVRVTFVTGYATIPAEIKEVVEGIVVARFQDRSTLALPKGVRDLLEPFCTGWFAA